MPVLSIRNLPEETHRALKARASSNGRSTEAEVRAILVLAVQPGARQGIGSRLAGFAEEYGGIDLPDASNPAQVEPASFE